MMRQADIDHCIAALSLAPSKYPLKKITDSAHNRMLTRTAKEQLTEALKEASRGVDDVVPDADDEAMQRAGVLT